MTETKKLIGDLIVQMAEQFNDMEDDIKSNRAKIKEEEARSNSLVHVVQALEYKVQQLEERITKMERTDEL